MKICPVAAQLLYADGQTDMTKLIVALRNFANAPTNDPQRYKQQDNYQDHLMKERP